MPDAPATPVKLPQGRQRKVLLAVGVVAAGYVGWRWWQARSAPAGPPVTGDVGDAGVLPSGVVGSGGGGNIQYATAPPSDTRTEPKPGNFANNAEWTAYAVDKMASRDPGTVMSALGDFLARRPLTAEEESIVVSALAVAGDPPVGGPYTIVHQVGDTNLAAPTGLRAADVTRTSVDLTWNPVPNAFVYFIWQDSSGANVGGTTVPKKTIAGLTPGRTYRFAVGAATSTGKNGARSPQISVTTKK